MPIKAPRLCGCGATVAGGQRCACKAKQDAERKARFDKTRPNSSQRGYSGTWDKAKKAWLQGKRCVRCGAPATTVDHKTPHQGNMILFWDKTNWQPLCAHDHNSAKQREDRRLP